MNYFYRNLFLFRNFNSETEAPCCVFLALLKFEYFFVVYHLGIHSKYWIITRFVSLNYTGIYLVIMAGKNMNTDYSSFDDHAS